MNGNFLTYLYVSAALFCLGLFGILTRRNMIAVLISLQLILNAALLNFLALDRFILPPEAHGQTLAFFAMILGMGELCVGLSLAIVLIRRARATRNKNSEEPNS